MTGSIPIMKLIESETRRHRKSNRPFQINFRCSGFHTAGNSWSARCCWHEWNDQRPKWASGHLCALWRSDAESFVSVFMWWENPEDPPILLAGRAAATMLSQDNDPWNWEWMERLTSPFTKDSQGRVALVLAYLRFELTFAKSANPARL